MMRSSAAVSYPYSEKRPDNFVLSEETPISTGHGFLGMSSSTEPVDILSYGVHFRIPRNYINSALHHTRDHTMDFILTALYPDMIGSTVTRGEGRLTEEEKVWIWGSSPNLINITTVGGDIGKNVKEDYDNSVFTSEANEPDHPWRYGLLQSTRSNAATLQNVYFTRATKSEPGHVIFCSREKDPVHDCVMYLRVSDDLLLHCKFHLELLPQWREINQKLERLIQSFIVKGK